MESFWERMQTERMDRNSCTTVAELSVAMANHIATFYDIEGRHCSLNHLTPF